MSLLRRTRLQFGVLCLYATSQVAFVWPIENGFSDRSSSGTATMFGTDSTGNNHGSALDGALELPAADEERLPSPPEMAMSLPSLSPASKSFMPRNITLPTKRAAAFLGFAVLLALWLGPQAWRAVTGETVDGWLRAAAWSPETRSLFLEMVERHKAQHQVLCFRVANLKKVGKQAEDLTRAIGSQEAKDALERLLRRIRSVEKEEKYLEEAFENEQNTRPGMHRLRRLLDDAVADASVLFELAHQYFVRNNREAASLVAHSVKEADKMAVVAYHGTAISQGIRSLHAHGAAVSYLSSLVMQDSYAIQSIGDQLNSERIYQSALSLQNHVACVEIVTRICQRMRATAAKIDGWVNEGEESAQIMAQSRLGDLIIRSLILMKQKEQLIASLKAAKVPHGYPEDRQNYWGIAEHVDEYIQRIHEVYRKHSTLSTSQEIITSVAQASKWLEEAEKKLDELSVANSRNGYEEPTRPLEGKPPALDNTQTVESPEQNEKLRSRLLSISTLATEIAKKAPTGSSWSPPSSASKMLKQLGAPELFPSEKFKPLWEKEVGEAVDAASKAKALLDEINNTQDISTMSAKVDTLLRQSAVAIAHAKTAALQSIEAKMWKRLEDFITTSTFDYQVAVASVHAPEHGFMDPQEFSLRISEIFKQGSVTGATLLAVDMNESMQGFQQIVAHRELAARSGEEMGVSPPRRLVGSLVKQDLLNQAEVAKQIVAKFTSRLAELAKDTSYWSKTTEILEAEEAAALVLDAESILKSRLLDFSSACAYLESASTEWDIKAAGSLLLQAKEKVLEVVLSANASAQKAALAIHQKDRFHSIAKADEDAETTGPETSSDYTSQINKALLLARKAGSLHEKLAEQVLALTDKSLLYESSAPAWLVGERELAKSLVQHISKLAKTASKKPDSAKFLLAEARHCAYLAWVSCFNVEALLTDIENNLDVQRTLTSLGKPTAANDDS